MYRLLLLMCATAGLICSPQADAQRGMGVGWSIGAAASGWYLQRVAGTGERIQLSCSPVLHGHWLYHLDVKSNQASSGHRDERVEMLIDRSPETWHYQLAVDGPGSAGTTLNRSSFVALLQQLNSLALGDAVSVRRLGFSIAPRNSDQETTFVEFRKLCRLDLRG